MEEKVNGHYENVPPHLTDWLKDKEKLASYDPKLAEISPEVLQHFAIDCVITNNQHYNHIFKNCCSICDKKLSLTDLSLIKPNDILVVCSDHRPSSTCFQVDLERKRLGIKPRDYV